MKTTTNSSADTPPGDGAVPRRVFFAFDFTDQVTADVVDALVDRPPPGLDPRRASGGQGDLWTQVAREIEAAAAVVALIDHANANVAFEYGYALGCRKECYLLQAQAETPNWIQGPPFHGLLRGPGSKGSEIRASLQKEGAVHTSPVVSGDRTVFLCPNENIGENLREFVARERPDWHLPDENGWNLANIETALARSWRVVWVVLWFDPTVTRRHGRANAAHAAVAGFARARGLDLKVLRHTAAIELVDVGRDVIPFENVRAFEQMLGEFDRDLDARRREVLANLRVGASAPVAEPARSPIDPITAYRTWVQSAHATTVPFFGSAARALADVFVRRHVAPSVRSPQHARSRAAGRDPDSDAEVLGRGDWTLASLLSLERGGALDVTGRWVLLGPPGSGKSTLCRRLACELAEDANGPLPLLVSLERLCTQGQGDAFDLVEADTRRGAEGEGLAGLAERLRTRAKQSGDVWILLDGLDEVVAEQGTALREVLAAMAQAYPDCPILVTSRRTGYAGAPEPSFREAELLPLGDPQQAQLLRNWLGADLGNAAWERIRASERMGELAANPFLLTMLAQLSKEGPGLPRTRGALYREAVDLLLRRGYGAIQRGMKAWESARAVLAELSLALQHKGGEAWERADVHAVLQGVLAQSPRASQTIQFSWGSDPSRFLDDVERDSGLLGPHRGRHEPWRYLHRSLREYLAARALADDPALDTGGLIAQLESEQGAARWGETISLLVGLLNRDDLRRAALLEAIVTRDHDLAHHTLPQLEGLDVREALDLLDRVPPVTAGDDEPWNGDDLAAVLRSLRLDGHPSGELSAAILERVDPKLPTLRLAHLYYGLEAAGLVLDREAFFRRCERWPREGEPVLPKTVRIPVDGAESVRFTMGSPERVGAPLERPQRQVTLQPYCMAVAAVTEGEYERFDGIRPAMHPKCPVRGISWWEAWLYARWLGGHLPTEAQWECAARAGTQTQWSHGDDEASLEEYACYSARPGSTVQNVGTRRPNPWGLYDMHGNVFEWCHDWYGPYDPAQTLDPAGPGRGPGANRGPFVRVLRGGSFRHGAAKCRSAFRSWNWPWYLFDSVGFRVVLPCSRP
ncbi:MAG: SUMF1/EgtB/PvdO family nonheme iron enzyme [Planctomycetaceae bacterium]|nr:SUMF1/EgtB/PvdO family nonheme iron enzyme [Planctomycetaceae bacterium]